MYINNKYLAPTMKSRSIYHILRSQNCEMSFTSFSIENSIPNVKHFFKKKYKKKRKKGIIWCRLRVIAQYLGRCYKRYQGHGSVGPGSGQW